MFNEKRFISAKHTGEYLNFLEYAPESSKKLPLILYIHGAGSRGDNLSEMTHAGPIGELEKGREINAMILAPQCRKETWFDSFEVLTEFIDRARSDNRIDPERIYITGISMGAYATWQMCISHPDWFAAAVAVCGGGMYWDAARLKNIPIWAFHGDSDSVVFPEESLKMVSAVNRSGGNAKLTIVQNTEHNSWDYAFAQDEMWDWLFRQEKHIGGNRA